MDLGQRSVGRCEGPPRGTWAGASHRPVSGSQVDWPAFRVMFVLCPPCAYWVTSVRSPRVWWHFPLSILALSCTRPTHRRQTTTGLVMEWVWGWSAPSRRRGVSRRAGRSGRRACSEGPAWGGADCPSRVLAVGQTAGSVCGQGLPLHSWCHALLWARLGHTVSGDTACDRELEVKDRQLCFLASASWRCQVEGLGESSRGGFG